MVSAGYIDGKRPVSAKQIQCVWMITPEPFNIIFSFPWGADGPQIIKKSGWSGKGIVFSRLVFDQVRNHPLLNDPLNPLKEPGVYILWERGEESPRAYIGESKNPSDRINEHVRNEDKEFWTWAVVFSGGLNKAHIQYLEAILVILAEKAKRCNRGASNTPRKPKLGIEDKIEAEDFLKNMRLCLPIIGVDFLRKLAFLQKRRKLSSLSPRKIKLPRQPRNGNCL